MTQISLITTIDLSLKVKSLPSLRDSFQEYLSTSTQEGDYLEKDFGTRKVVSAVEILEFPSVLHLRLFRMAYDAGLKRFVKVRYLGWIE